LRALGRAKVLRLTEPRSVRWHALISNEPR
jgi:hypothetical protein